MGQSNDPSPDSDAVDETVDTGTPDDSEGFVSAYFWPILLGSILVTTGGGAGLVYLQYDQIDEAVRSSPYAKKISQVRGAIPYVGGPDTTAADGPRTYGSFAQIEGLVINPAESGGERYLAVSIAFESKKAPVLEELKTKKVVVRDAILNLLSERTVDELTAPDRRDALKKTLREETNSILRKGSVDRLYFTEFVLQ